MWDCMVELFFNRKAARTTPRVGIEFAKAMGHPDDASARSEWPEGLHHVNGCVEHALATGTIR